MSEINNFNYGAGVNYAKEYMMHFPDFDITWIGTRNEKNDTYVGKYFVHYEYEVSSGDDKIIVSWSPGTGLKMPVDFSFKGKDYSLEPTGRDEFVIKEGSYQSSDD